MFLKYKYFGILTKDKPDENEDQMQYDEFFCFRLVYLSVILCAAEVSVFPMIQWK